MVKKVLQKLPGKNIHFALCEAFYDRIYWIFECFLPNNTLLTAEKAV